MQGNPWVWLDYPIAQAAVAQPFTLSGAAIDIATAFGDARFQPSGYSQSFSTLAADAYHLVAYAHSTYSDVWHLRTTLAYVDLAVPALTIDRLGSGTGGVVATGLSCAGGSTTQAQPCGASYTLHAVVLLTAAPDADARFTGWGGACAGVGTCAVTMAGVQYVTASFMKATTETVTYYHTDAVGSVRALTDASGDIVTPRHDYGAFGEDGATMEGDPMRFGGKELDPETGLENFEARYYRNIWGRFTAVDPAGGSPGDPQSWNRYAYARNNPLKYVDPTGMTYSVCLPDLYTFGCQEASQIQLDEMCYSISDLRCDSSTIAGDIRVGDRKVGWYTETSFRDGDAALGEAMAWGGGQTLITDEMIFVDKATLSARAEQAAQLAAEQAATEAAYNSLVTGQMEQVTYLVADFLGKPSWTGSGYEGQLRNGSDVLAKLLQDSRFQSGSLGVLHGGSDSRSRNGILGPGSLQINIRDDGSFHVDVDRVSPYGRGIVEKGVNAVGHTVVDFLPWVLWKL